ncbi:MAG TPA: DUF4830 domain-containing protein [Clostridiales bacterium]|nr:DUF4830 domain-containing protein [Clostridiales bacterium]
MFFTKKISKKTFSIIVLVSILLIMLVLRFTACGFKKTTAESITMGTYTLLAGSNESCIDFLSQFGWTADNEPAEVEDVKIPMEFNETFNEYNELQRQQGLDLANYKGKVCQRRSYNITNYGTDTQVKANLLVYNGVVIGGDICSVELDGFMHTFDDKTKE